MAGSQKCIVMKNLLEKIWEVTTQTGWKQRNGREAEQCYSNIVAMQLTLATAAAAGPTLMARAIM